MFKELMLAKFVVLEFYFDHTKFSKNLIIAYELDFRDYEWDSNDS